MSEEQRVIVTDIRMPFISMVFFMVKWVIASIPAFFILAVIASIFMGIIGGMGGMMH
ncbi:hypothetical protein [Methylobacter sp. YRD-M1]|uniref:hypothetical protein n=1 Tax=Methylobacter sp. YRD-M1 TaxID=2911520 RepID=UPI00227BC071|nr:hypothetical protein [Methylobacter sp. YRD-M1]WAK04587.1 hypothetical protein LZ558_22610 [Methylobacter sp. YRD-M1]